ncbi:hypothetical protein GCM10027187_40610 [Streptosporangium sandarakinum]|uniref:Uncharacterized protein n=1 Tax=Streptosporangium sandarakinum TaxID=1260955 RepID=A0A852V817_9ACTN|nr:hypothetical protein [Streptosporangium sandarakinum]NYF44609.1 hypothetical protein [Streptosporangium sandarakinum]
MIVTVALLRATLTALSAHYLFTRLPVMVTSHFGSWAHPLTTTIRFGYLQPADAGYDDIPMGRLTRNPGDGPAVAALTANPLDHVTHRDLDKAPTVAQLARALGCVELLDPALPVVIPAATDWDGRPLLAPIDFAMECGYYDPYGEHHHGVWGHDETDGQAAHVLWPIPAHRAATPPAPIRPVDWLARLNQTDVWVDPYGRERPVNAMDFYDTCAALGWLEVNAAAIVEDLIRGIRRDQDAHPAVLTPAPAAPAPLLEAARAVHDPRAWITTTPLAQALIRPFA